MMKERTLAALQKVGRLGSDPPFAATGTKVGLGPITTHVHTNYGSGYAMEVMREHLERVWQGQA